jgi:hypothetical protein
MFKKVIALLLTGVLMLMLVGCAAHIHKVGKGAQGNEMIEKRQWYALFGLIPINEVKTEEMAGNAKDYTITTQQSVMDVILNIFTSYVTVQSRTVTVEK